MTAVWSRRPDWRVAVGLCVVPGLGQLYNGQPRKAGFFFLATLIAAGLAAVLVVFNGAVAGALVISALVSVVFGFVVVLLLVLLVVVTLFFWASAITDAQRTARALASGDLEAAARVSFFRL